MDAMQKQVFSAYFEKYGVVGHQINGFNDFLLYGIQKVLDDEPNIHVDGSVVDITNATFEKPARNKTPLTPAMARELSLTYDCNVFVDVFRDGQFLEKVLLFSIPVMVGSVACNLHGMTPDEKLRNGELIDDQGGYFVINGKERIITGQMKRAYNKIFCHKTIDSVVVSEIRSFCEESAKSQLVQIKFNNKKTEIDAVVDKVPYKLNNILSALGHMDLVYEITGASSSIHVDEAVFMVEEAPLTPERVPDICQLFPHMGHSTNLEKTVLLCKMLRKMVLCDAGIVSEDDIGDLAFKRVDMAGVLCQDLFKMLWKQFIKSIIKESNKRKFSNLISTINYKKKNIGLNFQYCFSTGTWGIKKNAYKKLGVSEFAQYKVSNLTNLGLLRKFNIPISKKDKNVNIRMMHPSSIFFVCPFETPEGSSVGTKLSLAASATVSLDTNTVLVTDMFHSRNIVDPVLDYTKTIVSVNGCYIGHVEDWEAFVASVELMRADEVLARDVSVSYDEFINVVEIWCDSGRLVRPLLVTEKLRAIVDKSEEVSIDTWERTGVLVVRDAAELNKKYINDVWDMKTFSDYTEIDPSLSMGVVAGQIVFSNHTQSPRVCYMSNMIKQAMGVVVGHPTRLDATTYTLDHVQRPLNTTRMAELLGTNDVPNGVNAVVAVACYTGFNQEDSIILNKSAVDRGLFRATCRRTIVSEIKNMPSFEEIVCIPPKEKRLFMNYSKLGSNGVIRVGQYVNKGDVVIGKTMVTKANGSEKVEDSSVVVRTNEEGFVENVFRTGSYIKVSILQVKVPEIGDKFCSGMAQKGTCGMMLNQEDMPFTSSGMTPDLIINPHCLPSRMTINQLMSSVCSKARCVTGDASFADGSPFSGTDLVERAAQVLKQNGYSEDGTETLYNGFTGKKLHAKIFMGPVYQHRLTHLVSNKIFSSVHTNAKNKLTRQPLNGRANDGGLRIGEMEKDCLLRHGVVKFSNERLLDLSDKHVVHICNDCKSYYHVVATKNSRLCTKCKSVNVSSVSIPYAAKLLTQELESIGLSITME
ncbi:hypothetical protein AV955_gp073 [Diadromus pulchellus ascovirus 4a]|uniref:DNA-directed RNA polymerase n=1 Tax=Diadromus pulchellus ascovirus 4a TaxID=158683 RepID=F2NZ02_9VIRU|nr:hypothetical protein AV955_gp073 [Diadromus pulchellus ascovirus 4a]CCA61430.1 unnamed protein product [Diadromus pulchellus ascovirus 4a]